MSVSRLVGDKKTSVLPVVKALWEEGVVQEGGGQGHEQQKP